MEGTASALQPARIPGPLGPSPPTMSTSTEEAPTICPGCGAKIPRRGLSMCPYCITPLSGGTQGDASPVAERLARMEEKPGFEEAVARIPEEGVEWQRAASQRIVGQLMIFAGIGFLALYGIFGGPDYSVLSFNLLVAVVLLIAGSLRFVRGKSRMAAATAKPMLKRAAILHERRSVTEVHGGDGETVYYYDIEFGDGVRGEFRYPGRGPSEEPWPNGATGVAYTRGDELIDFERVRV
jgi:hypothetical protein